MRSILAALRAFADGGFEQCATPFGPLFIVFTGYLLFLTCFLMLDQDFGPDFLQSLRE
jgi:hypothetical protein